MIRLTGITVLLLGLILVPILVMSDGMIAHAQKELVLKPVLKPVLSLSKGLSKETPEPTPKPPSPPQPTAQPKKEEKATPVPTPIPSPTTEEKPAPLPTPTSELQEPLPTLLPTSTIKPPAPPTPESPTSTDTPLPAPTDASSPTPSPTPASVTITGLVFDDRDSDGARGSDEPGIGGVPVVLDGQIVNVTDAGGYFNLSLPDSGRALLSIMPPQGWQWRGEPMNAEGENVAIPLYRLEPAEASKTVAKATTTATVAGSVIVVVLLAFNGAASLLQTMAVRSLTHTYRQQKAWEMEYRQAQVIARRKVEVEQLLAETGDWRQVLAQVIADAVPDADVAWLSVTDVLASPAPRFDVVGEDGERYAFTVAPDAVREQPVLSLPKGWTLKRGRPISLDASLSPTIRVEVQIVWNYLAEQHDLDLRLLPRRAEWYLVVQRNAEFIRGGG